MTLKVMPDSPEADLNALKDDVNLKIEEFVGEPAAKVDEQPVAFGLKSLSFLFVMEESKGSTEELENDIATLPAVASVEVTDVRRAIG